MNHLRAHLFLFAFTVFLCCVLYPAVLYAVGRGLFPTSAAGSLVTEGGEVRGSHLIAQPFTTDEYFWPRPSAAAYNGAVSGGSNWGANNPKLRDRVAQFLAANVQYKKTSRFYTGPEPTKAVQRDMEAWAAAKPDRLAEWAGEFEVAAASWKAGDPVPTAVVFEVWLRDPANAERAAELEPVVADMVTASGSGLDPHVTVRNALSVYQLDRVAAKRTPAGGDARKVREGVAALVRDSAFTPIGGLVGEPLVNVMELNVGLDRDFPLP